MEERLVLQPFTLPASIGPPDTKTVGTFTLAAAIRRPGTFLSQLGIITRASNWCASAIHSVESAIKSLVTREYLIPTCPMAIPSQTAIAGKTTGIPPASATPSLTASTILSIFICPGTISLYELTIPTIGFFISSAVKPSALNKLLAGACFIPALALSLFIYYILSISCAILSPISLQPIKVLPSLKMSPVL